MTPPSAVRAAAVAGLFYPGAPVELDTTIKGLLHAAKPPAIAPKALIVPHAGYIYSGAVAASAYATLLPLRQRIRRVVLLGPVHRIPVRGLATTSAVVFDTPLGTITIDIEAIKRISGLPQVSVNDMAHIPEHSLEVQLPFLQEVLEDFSLVPLVVGNATENEIAEVLELLWGGDETLILISSDLSHYHPYNAARQLDGSTADMIMRLQSLGSHEQACGATPINGLLVVARRKGLKPTLLDLRNSGDTAGDKARVVGYASFGFEEAGSAAEELGRSLLIRARNAITAQFGQPAVPEPAHPELAKPGATFVTLTQNGKLRGCIGSLEARRVLEVDIRGNAYAAAFRDPRFAPLRIEELPITRVEVSLLSPATAMTFTDETDAMRQLRPNIDGVILECEGRRSTFLPQVWESLPQPKDFLVQLKLKAGLSATFWSHGVKLYRYEVQKWKEALP